MPCQSVQAGAGKASVWLENSPLRSQQCMLPDSAIIAGMGPGDWGEAQKIKDPLPPPGDWHPLWKEIHSMKPLSVCHFTQNWVNNE